MDEVLSGFLQFLPNTTQHTPEDRLDRLTPSRLVDPANPLTARVTVNRFWQQVFGMGLVKTTEDFGTQGEVLLQMELLDWLAYSFQDNGWNVKQLMRTMVTSHTYRQSSRIADEGVYQADPENRLQGGIPSSPARMDAPRPGWQPVACCHPSAADLP